MGFFCRCTKCNTSFIDQQGEFENEEETGIICPICGNDDVTFYRPWEIPDDYKPIRGWEDVDKIKKEKGY